MKNLRCILVIAFILITTVVFTQNSRKKTKAVRVDKAPIIDGILNDNVWKNASIANDFKMFKPGNGNPISKEYETEVRIIYDDEAIYFGAFMRDPNLEKIPMQFGVRNSFPQADFFGIILNPYDDKITEFEFFVMSTGLQADAISVEDAEDENWNQVWKSAVKITNEGWYVEVEIPYAALRFPKNKIQDWGLNFHRKIRNTNEQYSWSFIDKAKGLRSQQTGLLTNLTNLKPPLRLSLTPYSFFSVQKEDDTNESRFSAGMDLKLGINDSYTLDAVLIPEFGQTAFDEDVLNLSPFEQQFTENRAFFTEGTNLFSIGDLFYSRRIGQVPNLIILDENKVYENIPNGIPLINALKISGRNDNGLGIGIFNAITEKTITPVNNINTQTKEAIEISPLTNFNVLVLDQQFNKNSSISFVNTNVIREGSFKDANVSAFVLNLVNRNNYFLKASPKFSLVDGLKGFGSEFRIGKRSGIYQFEYFNEISSQNFDINDLGFQSFNNFHKNGIEVSYQIFEPNNNFNTFNLNLNSTITSLFNPSVYTGNIISLEGNATTKQQSYISTTLFGNLGYQKDFRYKSLLVDDTYFKTPTELGVNLTFISDQRKKINYTISGAYSKQIKNNTSSFEILINPTIRITNKFTLGYTYNFTQSNNEKGYVNSVEDDIIFGNRLVKTLENSIESTYYFNTNTYIDFSLRHFWSPVTYDSQFYNLETNGDLLINDYQNNHDLNYNSWNVNLTFFWQFAPGSQLVAQYRSAIKSEGIDSSLNFNQNFDTLFEQPSISNFSIKVLYYLDVNKLRKNKY